MKDILDMLLPRRVTDAHMTGCLGLMVVLLAAAIVAVELLAFARAFGATP